MKTHTAQTHRHRIAQALADIESHLDEPLSIPVLARRNGFSLVHFQRVFRQLVGESPYRYLQRLRLERAAFRLKRTEEMVTALALGSGYRTHEAFTRAFRAEFGAAPRAYRDAPGWPQGRMCGPAELVSVPAQRIAFVRHIGPYSEAFRAFAALRAWAKPHGLLPGAAVLGIPWDHKRVTAPERIRYDVALVLPAGVTDTHGIAVRELRGGCYVRVRHQGPYDALDHTYDYLHSAWIPAHGRRSANHPPFEIYIDNPANTPSESCRTDVYVPLAARLK